MSPSLKTSRSEPSLHAAAAVVTYHGYYLVNARTWHRLGNSCGKNDRNNNYKNTMVGLFEFVGMISFFFTVRFCVRDFELLKFDHCPCTIHKAKAMRSPE